MPLYSLVPSFRPLLAPVPRLRLWTDTQTDRQTHTQDNYCNPPAHAHRGLIMLNSIVTAIERSAVLEPSSLCVFRSNDSDTYWGVAWSTAWFAA